MMEKSDNNYPNQNIKADRCKICGKEGKGNAIKITLKQITSRESLFPAASAKKPSGLEML